MCWEGAKCNAMAKKTGWIMDDAASWELPSLPCMVLGGAFVCGTRHLGGAWRSTSALHNQPRTLSPLPSPSVTTSNGVAAPR